MGEPPPGPLSSFAGVARGATGDVPGTVLNQFSLDEYEGHLRVATTSGSAWDGTSRNGITVLDGDLRVVGSVDDLAPGERIYSARFLGPRGYLVTFTKVDPLFVIDLADPSVPAVLGYLKIPGFSEYLHPYDETHLIGVGKNTAPSGDGRFEWFQGMKLSLFDVSDVGHPTEMWKHDIGERGTSSPALHDHKAFLFSRSKDLLALPVTVYEHAAGGPWSYGGPTFSGAYVFRLTLEAGFEWRAGIANPEPTGSAYGYGYDAGIERLLYVEDSLYSLSRTRVRIHDLGTLEELRSVPLAP